MARIHTARLSNHQEKTFEGVIEDAISDFKNGRVTIDGLEEMLMSNLQNPLDELHSESFDAGYDEGCESTREV